MSSGMIFFWFTRLQKSARLQDVRPAGWADEAAGKTSFRLLLFNWTFAIEVARRPHELCVMRLIF